MYNSNINILLKKEMKNILFLVFVFAFFAINTPNANAQVYINNSSMYNPYNTMGFNPYSNFSNFGYNNFVNYQPILNPFDMYRFNNFGFNNGFYQNSFYQNNFMHNPYGIYNSGYFGYGFGGNFFW